jgi:predicted amidohydrolase
MTEHEVPCYEAVPHPMQLTAALAVPRLATGVEANWAEIERWTYAAAGDGATLVLFPEAALTGLVHSGDPEHDRQLAIPVPGAMTDQLEALARTYSLHLAIGVLERAGTALYDTALLFGPDGRILLKYRRINPCWHTREADLAVYRQGRALRLARTALGRFAFLICGDITDDALVARIRARGPDWLLVPIARGFDEDVHNERDWVEQEVGIYGERVRRAGAVTLLVNYVGNMDGFYGGAVAYRADGSVLACRPLYQPGLLIVDLSLTNNDHGIASEG